MTVAPLILTVDVGTSALKAVVYDGAGRVVASAGRRYGYQTPQAGWAEADPEAWWEALAAALDELRAGPLDLADVEALALTGQMHTAVLLDGDGIGRAADDPLARPARGGRDGGVAGAPGPAALSTQLDLHAAPAGLAGAPRPRTDRARVAAYPVAEGLFALSSDGRISHGSHRGGRCGPARLGHPDVGRGADGGDRAGPGVAAARSARRTRTPARCCRSWRNVSGCARIAASSWARATCWR